MLLVQINFQNVNLFKFSVESAVDDHSASFETMHQIGSVEAVNVVPGRQDQVAPQMLDAIDRAGVRRSPPSIST